MIKKYRKKPIVIEAIQWDGVRIQTILDFCGPEKIFWGSNGENYISISISTLEGDMDCPIGAYIVKGISGEFYPVQEDIFNKTYDKVSEELTAPE